MVTENAVKILIMNYKCYFCQIHSFEKLLKQNVIPDSEKQKAVPEFFSYLGKIDEKTIAPHVARKTNAIIKKLLNNSDPYESAKKISNKFLLEKYDNFSDIIKNSKNKFDTAIRLSIAGNIIDSIGAPDSNISETINYVLNSDFSINHSEKLKAEIEKAETVLYLGDNAGEIVLDKLFIETINHKNLYFAVRDKAVINDATIEDAIETGMDKVAKVISNGDNSPSTVLSRVSDEFKELYDKADVIISKGMGNLESLLHNGNKKIYFLLMIKCEPIAELTGTKKNDFVVFQNS